MVVKELLYIVLVGVGDRYILLAENDTETIYLLSFRHVYNIAAMGAQKLWTRQVVLQFLHIHQTHNLRSVFQIDTHIVLQTLNVENVVQRNADEFVVAFDKHKTILGGSLLALGNAKPVECFIRRF